MTRRLLCISLGAALSVTAAKLPPSPAYMNVAEAAEKVSGFPMIGEFVSKDGKSAIQTTILKDDTFLVAEYKGGLPGAGWDGSAITSTVKKPAELQTALAGFQRVERKSPTLGKPAPANAAIQFPDGVTNVKDGIMMAGGKTAKDLGSFHMHLEFKQPLKPGRNPSNQDRGNSGIYIFNNYEIQVIDTFALDYNDPENNAIETESANKQWCGSFYKQKLPDVNMTFPPLQWQTYDIDFTAPVFKGDKKVKNARVTVRHNGVLIHDDFELKTGTGNGAKKPQLARGPVYFQNHGNPVQFRNVWATEL